MSDKFQPINRYTTYLLPPSLQDWLPEKHLARFVVDIVDQLDLSRLVNHYGGGGKAPYHPALLLGLLFYGYATGVFSSRKLEQATHDSVAFRFITGDTHPDHDTIATFRKRFLPELEGLFVQMLVVAKEMGLFKLGKVSLDGTKIKANASKHKALSWGYAKQLEEQLRREVQALLRRAEQVDAEEEPEFDIPDELARREDRLAAIKKAKEEIERRARAREGQALLRRAEQVDAEEEPEFDIPDELARREDRLAAIKKAKEEIERRARARFEGEQAEYEAKLKKRRDQEAETGKKARGREPKQPEAGPPCVRIDVASFYKPKLGAKECFT